MEPYRHETMMMADYDIVSDIIDTMMEIYDEYDGGKKYINEAIALKTTDKARADKLVTMSAQELGHGNELSATVDRMMEKAKRREIPVTPPSPWCGTTSKSARPDMPRGSSPCTSSIKSLDVNRLQKWGRFFYTLVVKNICK